MGALGDGCEARALLRLHLGTCTWPLALGTAFNLPPCHVARVTSDKTRRGCVKPFHRTTAHPARTMPQRRKHSCLLSIFVCHCVYSSPIGAITFR